MLFMIAPLAAVWTESVKREGSEGVGPSLSMKNYSHSCNGTDFGNAWQSPVPYLLGGVAAMLLVITLAILTLTCSCWRSPSTNGAHGVESLEHGGKVELDNEQGEKVAVIMAGDENPTFIATPTPMAA